MKKVSSFLIFAVAFAAATSVSAEAWTATATASGGLTAAPSNASMTARGGLSAYRNVLITNSSTGFASNIATSLTHTGNPLGTVQITGDTCNGATLAPNGTCQISLEFDSTCPKGETAFYTLTLTSSTLPALTIGAHGNSSGGQCI